jgi:signal peptidase I
MKEIFVLGAGASAASGNTPLGNELVWNYHADSTSLKTYNSKGVPDLREDNKKFQRFENFLKVVEKHYPELEGIRLKYNQRGDRFFHAPFSPQKKYYIDEILRVIQERGDIEGVELIRNLIYEHIVYSSIGYPDIAYGRFKNEILNNRIASSVSIISLNFDYLLHEDFREEISFDYVVPFDKIDENRARQYKRKNPIPLIKLNGSLDWGICDKCDCLFLYFLPRGREFFINKMCDSGCGQFIRPFIVIPHERHRDRINSLWNKAKMELRQAKKVTIIGYSFPEYDHKVISLFQEALPPNVELEIVDYCESNENEFAKRSSMRQRYSKMFPYLKTEIKIHLGGFRTYIDDYNKYMKSY